jgi:hypothetical protein
MDKASTEKKGNTKAMQTPLQGENKKPRLN